ncbi:MAG: ABC transporter substrate-binding protein [Roseiflexus sp.]|nr:ABC transporter substrate-binding protein [Roseiflexus sp.]MCS7291307.1 ABC transporter substrate-binding protein [Roseiflexus sp.]MDW8146648.1 ABC transporter substrate-binding protein [Roseiflexaceae bacterium]
MLTTKWLKLFGVFSILALALAACGAPAPSQPTAAPAQPTTAPAQTGGKLEIFSWWTNAGEADGLNAMFELYKQQNPGVEIINATVAGGAGTNAKTVLKTRLQGGQPPDSWQVHAGKELTSYVDAGQMVPLTQFFKEQGFDKVMPPKLLEQITYKGEIWSVPVNIHRSNVLWYNIKIFQENGLTPPKTIDDFFKVAEALKAKGIIPLAVGGKDRFETPHLFESVLLAVFGPEDYPKLFQPGADWSDPRVRQAAEIAKRMLEYSNSDRSSLGWADAAQLVLDGKAAMTIMGDWAHGYFIGKGAKVGVDYGYAPAPGNEGVFMWLSDSFGLAKGAPNPEQAKAWLALCGSREGQDAFNPKKGSIPARTDADVSLYDEYLQYSIKAFSSEKLVPSVVHGAAAPEAYMTEYGNALNVFASDLDVDAVVEALKDAAKDLK